MKYILINYNFDPSWVKEYTNDYLIYDRSETDECLKDIPKDKIIKTRNIGQVDYDKLGYLVDNYETLPDVFLWGKSNLFKFLTKNEFEFERYKISFTPLFTQYHKVGRPLCFYDDDGMYNELNEDAYIHISKFPNKNYSSYSEFAHHFGLPNPEYLAFPPGGNYILTKEVVHRYPREFYQDMRSSLPYDVNPAEAHMCERSYYTLWK